MMMALRRTREPAEDEKVRGFVEAAKEVERKCEPPEHLTVYFSGHVGTASSKRRRKWRGSARDRAPGCEEDALMASKKSKKSKSVVSPVDRRLRLSATEMVTLYGVSPYAGASPHNVFADHVYDPEPGDGKMALWLRLGTVVEPLALRILAEETRQTLRRCRTRVCAKHPWLVARPDALAVPLLHMDYGRALRMSPLGPNGARRAKAHAICEAKFVSDPRMAQLWFDARPRPPLYVHVQAQVEMTVCGLRKACGIGLVLGNPYICELDHDDALEQEILAIGQDFLRTHIEPKVPPPWDGSRAADRLLQRRYPTPDETFRRADLAAAALARDYMDAQRTIAAQTKKRNIAEQGLKDIIGDRIGLLGEEGAWKATWKAPRVGKISWKPIAQAVAGERGVPREVIEKNT